MGRFDGEAKRPRIRLPRRWARKTIFHHDVEQETEKARNKFMFPGCHLENDNLSRPIWLSAIEEEVGKLCRACNKLVIVSDPSVREGYLDEGYHRILTASSLLRRLAENWENLPDR